MNKKTPDAIASTSKSPAVTVPLEMNFPDALYKVIEGKKITRIEWDNHNIYVLLRDGFLSIFQDGKFSRLLVSDGDLTAPFTSTRIHGERGPLSRA